MRTFNVLLDTWTKKHIIYLTTQISLLFSEALSIKSN